MFVTILPTKCLYKVIFRFGIARNTSRDNLLDVDGYAYFGFHGNTGGLIGIAFVSTMCRSDKSLRTSITEWFQSDLQTAEVYKDHQMILIFKWLIFADICP